MNYMQELLKPIETEEWYQALVLECKAIMTEGLFASKWVIIETYHQLGKALLEANDNFERSKIYGEQITTHVSQSIGKSKRTVERAIQFAKMYPSLEDLPGGKNITWAKIVSKHLPKKKDEACEHPLEDRSYFFQCKKCRKWVKQENN